MLAAGFWVIAEVGGDLVAAGEPDAAFGLHIRNEIFQQAHAGLPCALSQFGGFLRLTRHRREQEWLQQSQKQENEFSRRLSEEQGRLRQSLEESLRKSISTDFENRLRLLQEANKDNEDKLRTSRQKELEFLKKEQDLKNKEAELELSVQRQLQEERGKLSEEIRQLEESVTDQIDRRIEVRAPLAGRPPPHP